ncbi:MAG: TRAM domain-containing protein [Myxococcota bacterium]|nr:TRAM domain-containing protein [Myxococcota bacterium]
MSKDTQRPSASETSGNRPSAQSTKAWGNRPSAQSTKTPAAPRAQNAHHRLHIERVALGGDGIARADGKVIFIPGALPDEQVEAHITEDRARFCRASLCHVLQASPLRRSPDCVHEQRDACGGCGWRHVSDAHSLRLKTEAALAELRKLSATACPEPTLHPTPLDGTRIRARLHLDGGKLGFYARSSQSIVDLERCPALHPKLLATTLRLKPELLRRKQSASVLLELDGEDRPFASLLPKDKALASILASAVESGLLAGFRMGSQQLGLPWVEESVDWPEPSSPVALGTLTRKLHFVHRAGDFWQSSRHANQQLRLCLAQWLRKDQPKRVLDAYAGSGNLSFVAAREGALVVALDSAKSAREAFEEGALRNQCAAHASFIAHDLSFNIDPALLAKVDAVILDPPREGARTIVDTLAEAQIPRIFYVSCNPASLARDLGRLKHSYTLLELHAFDMFPRTPHLELLAVIEKR